jgi:hypothetical protein
LVAACAGTLGTGGFGQPVLGETTNQTLSHAG